MCENFTLFNDDTVLHYHAYEKKKKKKKSFG
jgi:hypothetical protein